MQDIVADFERSTILRRATVSSVRVDPGVWVSVEFTSPRAFVVYFTNIVDFSVDLPLWTCHVSAWSAFSKSKFLDGCLKHLDERVHFTRDPTSLLHFRLEFGAESALDVVAEHFHFVICER